MTPGELRAEIVAERSAWVRDRVAALRRLPLSTFEEFTADPRTPAAAESFLRRALEALLDLGRHVLAKGFGRATTEYKETASALAEEGVIDQETAGTLREMAGYRNRLVHFYDQVTLPELYRICKDDAADIEQVLGEILGWIRARTEADEGG